MGRGNVVECGAMRILNVIAEPYVYRIEITIRVDGVTKEYTETMTQTMIRKEAIEAILSGRAVRLEAEPQRMPSPRQRPDFPPAEEVRISASSTNGRLVSP